MKYELYADVWFATNFTMDGLALWLAGLILKQKIRYRCILSAALVGTILSMSLFFCLDSYTLYQILVHILVNPLMVWLCFRAKAWRELLRQWFLTYLAVLLMGGILDWGMQTLGGRKYFWVMAAASVLILAVSGRMLGTQRRRKETVYDLLLVTTQGNLKLKGFYDSGNLLVDPLVHKPVHIIKTEALEGKLELKGLPVRMIPFHSLGQEAGLLEAVTLEGMYVQNGDIPMYFEKPVFGIAKEKLFQDDRYDVILNAKTMVN